MSQVPPPSPHSPQTPPPYPGGPTPPQSYGAPPPGYPQQAPSYPQQAPGYPQAAPGSGVGGPPVEIRPKARWFWVGGGIVVLGILGAIAMFVLGFVAIGNTVDDFERVSSDGGGVSIGSAGEYVVYNEGRSSSADVTITSPDGEVLRLSFYTGGLNYSFGDRSGEALYTFDAPTAGVYRVQTSADIAIGPSIAGDLVRTILLPFVIGGIAFVIGLIVVIVVAVRRSGSKKRAARGV